MAKKGTLNVCNLFFTFTPFRDAFREFFVLHASPLPLGIFEAFDKRPPHLAALFYGKLPSKRSPA